MANNLELSLLIPTYNEEEIIGTALIEIEKALGPELTKATEIFIVDDGTDNLIKVVDAQKPSLHFAHVQVQRNTPGVGKGQSLVWGFQNARAPFVGFLDVDLSTPPRYIKEALTILKSNSADIFIGSRRATGAVVNRDQFFLKDILGKVLGVIARGIIFSGMRSYADTQCGFKFYKNAVAKSLYKDLVAPDGLNDLEILIRANLLGYKVHEQGVAWTDLRESKRSLRRILFGELVAICRILVNYKFFAASRRRNLKKTAVERNLQRGISP